MAKRRAPSPSLNPTPSRRNPGFTVVAITVLLCEKWWSGYQGPNASLRISNDREGDDCLFVFRFRNLSLSVETSFYFILALAFHS